MSATTRITAGEWKGRSLVTPAGRTTRPTRSMVREALFNILGERIIGAQVIDLFAGAGSVGFEALSRGAASVVMVDSDRAATDAIRRTAEVLGCTQDCSIVDEDALRWLRRNADSVRAADLCFIDAPYRDNVILEVMEVLGAAPSALVICEHHRQRRLADSYGEMRRVRTRRYGLTELSIYERSGGAA